MRQDLDTLRGEILAALESGGFVIFHGSSRIAGAQRLVRWDSARHPDFHLFLETARKAEARFIVFHHREFSGAIVEDTLDRLESCDMPRDEHRNSERRLRELLAYDGFTCAIEISFDYQEQVYIYDVSTPWYEEFLELADEIEDWLQTMEPGEEEGPMGGYYSQN